MGQNKKQEICRVSAIAHRAARAFWPATLALALLAPPAGGAHATEYAALVPVDRAQTPVAARSLDGAPMAIATDPSRVTLVHFFASWCEPCADELPALARFVRADPARVRLIGVAVAEPAVRAQRFAARFDLPAELATDPDRTVAAAFAVRSLPSTVALAPDGRALAAAGPVDWTSDEAAAAVSGLKNKH